MKVSVIIPCYNVEHYIERCLESVRTQTHHDVETICVDDGSTDGTVDRIRAWQERTGHLLHVRRQPNGGATAARNAGLVEAQGIWIQFLDADDILLPEKLEHQLAVAACAPSADMVIGSSIHLDHLGNVRFSTIQRTNDRDPWMDLMAHGFGVTSALLWRREAVVRAGGWQEGLGSSQEYDLLFNLLQQGARAVYDELPLTEIHERTGGSISQTNRAANWVRYVELRGHILEHLRSLNDGRDLQPFVQVLFDNIRVLYDLDPKAAMDLHARLIPSAFRPRRSPTSGSAYIGLHRLLGFHGAQRVRGWLARSSAPVTG